MVISQIPMEWMDPMSWRLPSGKKLAEFALQAGFLAPLMLGTPSFRKRKPSAAPVPVPGKVAGGLKEHVGEEPARSGTFHGTAQ
ncbi:MAG TPA: hypothetical protein VGN17_31530 [Bryobacteraceae bacterium]